MSSGFRKCILVKVLLFALAGCSDELDLPVNRPKVVIEGFIEQDEYPLVYLTLSSGYYEPVDSSSLLELVLTTARVAISDGEQEEVLTLFRNTEVFPPFYYQATDIRGEVGKAYTLEVRSRQDIYVAETVIKQPLELDSIWFQYDEGSDNLGNIWIEFQDNPLEENFYRVFTRRRGKDSNYVPIYQSAIGDRSFNGEQFQVSILRGSGAFSDVTDDFFFEKGDTVDIRFCTIDKPHFDFWRTLEQELYLTGNPFGSVGNEISSNVEGTRKALGVWGGYGASYYQYIVK